MRRDAEPDLLVHQSRLVERDQAVGIGVVADAAGRLQFHHRHAAAGMVVDDLDGEVAAGLRRWGRCPACGRQE